ncbi:glycosyltransferase [Lentzea aerocolonigenes]|uniref:glycosyltransferase n=1 Tax=Lentzea aerocolonigenes TaxID=68170 RepID=UPI0004C44649|nr:glycosyltransferase [Lentzea aerocolonigenes]MCP2244764.1 Glycosyltransferase, GT2 family [Lentzea aerocolonigenes]MCP2245341.1 Glycosyltransferase, GT2 family [Lentzea aerocolonigenes]
MELDRRIEWTGERCVPWTEDTQVVYEHYHRYALARDLVAGKRVLDLASGEGYGAAMLAETAAEVVGVDIDVPSVEHAQVNYGGAALRFVVGSITDPAVLADAGQFDVITCFEAIEHVTDHAGLMELIGARLAPGGLLLISTPDTEIYSHEHHNCNEFHLKELTEHEFDELLRADFANVAMFRQNVAVGSVITATGSTEGSVSGHTVRAHGDTWSVERGLPHTYLFALASQGPLPPLPAAAIMLDPDQTLAQRRAGQLHALYESTRAEVEELKSTIQGLEQQRQAEERNKLSVLESLSDSHTERERLSAELHQASRNADRSAAVIEWMQDSAGVLEQRAIRAEAEVQRLREQVAEQNALVQRALGKYRNVVEKVAPRGSTLRDTYERALGRQPGVMPQTSVELRTPVAVHTSDKPLASIIIPVHGKWSYTRQCLLSINAVHPTVPFEVIVVDDASPDDSAEKLAACTGVRLVRTPRNLGFIGACNLGAEKARSELLVFLNNDTEVTSGWLEALVETANSDDRIGLVGAKLVYPDGTLQEAGGIIWSDATGWNYGRNGDPNDQAVNVLRDVDYCSGAAILVRRDLFERIGGFDTLFAPAYYEDTDLAFAIRAAGHRVVVQPKSVVVHHEGISHGKDVSSGVKRHQELNRTVFAEKWADALTRQLPGPSEANLWLARQRDPFDRNGPLVLVMDHQVPLTRMDSGSVRMRAVLEELVGLGCRVVFFAANGSEHQPDSDELRQLGITVLTQNERQWQFLREAASELSFALLSRPNVAWIMLEELRTRAPQCVIAYDTVDLHFLRLERQAAVAERDGHPKDALGLRRKANAVRELELGLVRATDVTFVVSEAEQQILLQVVPGADVRVLSNVHTIDWTPASVDGRTDVVFVGGYDHVPNRDAAQWLAKSIMPLVRKEIPDAMLRLAGSNPTKDVLGLHDEDAGVDVLGFVDDLGPVYARARITVAPLRYGAGVKGKIGQSVSVGVPVVGTTLALEGMHLVPEQDVLLGDTEEEIARAIVRLMRDDDLWYRLSRSAKEKVAAQFGPQVARTVLEGLLK